MKLEMIQRRLEWPLRKDDTRQIEKCTKFFVQFGKFALVVGYIENVASSQSSIFEGQRYHLEVMIVKVIVMMVMMLLLGGPAQPRL